MSQPWRVKSLNLDDKIGSVTVITDNVAKQLACLREQMQQTSHCRALKALDKRVTLDIPGRKQ